MKTLVLSIISLFTVSLWSFANEDDIKAQVPNHANNESIIYSSNTNVNDYSKREFSPEGIIMPRMGEYYEGAISYNNVSFPLYIYWDLEIFKAAKDLYEKNDRMLNITAEYIGSLGRQGVEYLGKSYWDSPTVVHRNITILQGESEDFERMDKR